MRTRAVLLVALAALLALPGAPAMADDHVQTVVDFDPAAGEFPRASPRVQPATCTSA